MFISPPKSFSILIRVHPQNAIQCAQVALWIKEMFDNLGLEIFIKSSGSKGMQVYVPLNTPTTYKETSPFAKAVGANVGEGPSGTCRLRHEEKTPRRQGPR